MKSIFIIILSAVFAITVKAQSPGYITGTVADSTASRSLLYASISVLNAKDTTLIDYIWAKSDGSFRINNLPTGKFIFLVAHHDYADYLELFELDSSKRSKNFGLIKLTLKSTLLQEVVINGAAAVRIKGDTTIFNASSFKTQPNDRVEDLLRQLPGIQVDQFGRITAHGKIVNRMYVEGEEFFGDDPTLITRNIRADMVDKVQLYDKKSDQAAFTGIDDGKKEKAINITLKADKKNGYFGKVDMGLATNGYYQGQIMFNAFKTKEKFSVFGNVGNTNRTGLTSQENSKYGTVSSLVTPGDLLESFSGRYTGEGLPDTRSGGAHYDSKWDSDKKSINLNYKIGSINVDAIKDVLNQNNLPSGTILSSSQQQSDKTFFRQKFDGIFQLLIDPSTTLKITSDAALSNNQVNTDFNSNSTPDSGSVLNTQNRNITNDTKQRGFNISALLTKKFIKGGQTASLLIKESYSDEESKGFLKSSTTFFNDNGTTKEILNVNQFKPVDNNYSNFEANGTFSQPFSKTLSLILNYGVIFTNSDLNIRSFNQSSSGNYDQLDNLFSSHFRRDLITNQTGAIINYNRKKVLLNLGSRVHFFNDNLLDVINNRNFGRDYINLNPQLSFRYVFTQRSDIGFSFNRNTIQPTINQLQPIRINTDPLNITLGNENLTPSFSNNFNLIHNFYDIKGQGILLEASYKVDENPIVYNTTTDPSSGASTYQPVNLYNKDRTSFVIGLATAFKVAKPTLSINIDMNISGGTSYNFSNNVLNKIQTAQYSATFTVSKFETKKYDFRISLTPGYNFNRSSIQSRTSNGWIFNSNAAFNVFLPMKFQLGGNVNYLFQAKTESFDRDFHRMILNPFLSKKFLKKENLTFMFSVNDLLNKNNGFVRSIDGTNMFTESSYNTIRRYFMFSIIWDFANMGANPQKK
jgi:hypothetical protein